MRVKFDRRKIRVGIAIGDGGSFSSWRRTTVENVRAVADQSRDELRGFILNNTEACPKSGGLGDVPVPHSSRRGKESAGSEFDSFGAEPVFCFGTTKADCGHGNRLVVLANAQSGIESVGFDPTFDEPEWVGTAGGESLG
jgi:hypothetical protein